MQRRNDLICQMHIALLCMNQKTQEGTIDERLRVRLMNEFCLSIRIDTTNIFFSTDLHLLTACVCVCMQVH